MSVQSQSGSGPGTTIIASSVTSQRWFYNPHTLMDATCWYKGQHDFQTSVWTTLSRFCLFSGITSCNFLLCCSPPPLFSFTIHYSWNHQLLKCCSLFPFSPPFFPPSWATDLTLWIIQWPQRKKHCSTYSRSLSSVHPQSQTQSGRLVGTEWSRKNKMEGKMPSPGPIEEWQSQYCSYSFEFAPWMFLEVTEWESKLQTNTVVAINSSL